MIWLQQSNQVRTVITFSYQPALRPALPRVYGPLDYREQRALFQRIDWVLLRDAARTLVKATVLVRKHGLKHRMPQGSLDFLSDMNILCMKMSDKNHAADGRKHRKKVLREMKNLGKRIAAHSRAHVEILKTRREETDLTEPQAQLIIKRIKHVLGRLSAAVKQAHERIIGDRRVANEDKILSLYDDQINVIKRGKAGAQVEFGNKLWLGETREGIIVDYQFYQENPSDTARSNLP